MHCVNGTIVDNTRWREFATNTLTTSNTARWHLEDLAGCLIRRSSKLRQAGKSEIKPISNHKKLRSTSKML
jgi:hypothetical protein